MGQRNQLTRTTKAKSNNGIKKYIQLVRINERIKSEQRLDKHVFTGVGNKTFELMYGK